MCGFIFTTSKNYKKKKIIESGKFIIARGPESNRYIETNNFKSYHTRLKILDTQSRKAELPIYDKKKNYFLHFNGEIYNFENIKLELLKRKIKFKTEGDSEVLFHCLKIFGIKKTLQKINGMFAFIFVDSRKKKIFAARDEFGQKPLYYSNKDNILTLSSNVRSIRNLTKVNELDIQNIRMFLTSNSSLNFPNKTLFKDILALKAGHYLSFNKNKLKIIKYFNPRKYFDKKKYYRNNEKSLDILAKETLDKLLESVKIHSISSRKLGIFLSGGIDSSLLYFLLKEKHYEIFKRKTAIKSLTVLHNKQLSYLPTQVNKIINKKLDKNSSIHFKKKDYFKNLINIIKFSGLPQRWGGGVPMYKSTKKFSKKNIKVIYSGDGADELLCGYMDIIKTIKNNKNLYSFPHSLKLNKNSIFYNDLDAKIYYSYLYNLRKESIIKFKFLKDKSDILTKCLQCEYSEFFLQSCTLIQSDEYSMANSVEVRHPYVNKIFFEKAINLPQKAICNLKSNTNKILLRNILKKYGYLFYDRKKEGTRNYSKFISKKKYWNFKSFYISQYFDLSKLSDWREIYKVINIEIFIRVHLSKNFNIMLTPIGKKTLL